MVQQRAILCDRGFQDGTFRFVWTASFVSRALLGCPSQATGPCDLYRAFSSNRSLNRRHGRGASDYRWPIPAEREQEAQSKLSFSVLYKRRASLYS
jgi:hypothetical protein